MVSQEEAISKARLYASVFLESYNKAINEHFLDTQKAINKLGRLQTLMPLYGKELGENVSTAVLYSEHDFLLYFLDAQDQVDIKLVGDDEGFTREWTFNTPRDQKQKQVEIYLGVEATKILANVNVTASNFLSPTKEVIKHDAVSHGTGRGNQDGAKAQRMLPELLEQTAKQDALDSLTARYQSLADEKNKQERGREFEILWRDTLDFYGWKPKKFRISGEENDFTAIYQGNHILGEVRWFDDNKPMTGGKMREFLGKLDPRPRTIGLFVSHSGFDDGATSVARRAVNTKTVVLFDKTDIEQVLVEQSSPANLFDEKLRDVYDSIFEQYS